MKQVETGSQIEYECLIYSGFEKGWKTSSDKEPRVTDPQDQASTERNHEITDLHPSR